MVLCQIKNQQGFHSIKGERSHFGKNNIKALLDVKILPYSVVRHKALL
jgi:hypothetical protein